VRYRSKRIAALQHSFCKFQTRRQKLGVQLDCSPQRIPGRVQVAPLQCD
jgi:hypothetical protein